MSFIQLQNPFRPRLKVYEYDVYFDIQIWHFNPDNSDSTPQIKQDWIEREPSTRGEGGGAVDETC